tara:strand:+ start:33798 stop:34532 length:735 start_codon:yes stop_codon:yes gene_type:complete
MYQNKTIVLTGGTKGIGLELCKLLYPSNKLLVIASNENNLNLLKNAFPNIVTLQCDLSQRKDIEHCVDQLESLESIDMLINNAAVQYYPDFLSDDFEFEGIRREISINFTAVCELTYLLLPKLVASKKAPLILNISSGLALAPKKSSAVYCATKAAITSFTRSLRYQLRGHGVDVYQAFPPLTNTQMTKKRLTQTQLSSPSDVALKILKGLESRHMDIYIGSINALRLIAWVAPWLARKIMSKN